MTSAAEVVFPVPPVIKSIRFEGGLIAAFDRFVLDIGRWWPLATHSIGHDAASHVAFVPLEVGGRLIETTPTGAQHVWGRIIRLEQPNHIVFSWHVGRSEDTAQSIDVQFKPAGSEVTEVVLTHSGWERLGEIALQSRDSYAKGWDFVLDEFRKGRAA